MLYNKDKRAINAIKNRCYYALRDRSLTRGSMNVALRHIEEAVSVDDIVDIMLAVINSQDYTIEKIVASLIDAESRAMPKSMFVPDGHVVIKDDK